MDKTSLVSDQNQVGYFPEVYGHLNTCPHCNAARPSVVTRYVQQNAKSSELFGVRMDWAIYECTTCAMPVSLVYNEKTYLSDSQHRHHYLVYPSRWQPDEAIPEIPRNYLQQAHSTLGSPDASVVMSASAIDAMLKVKGLTEGTLYKRIDQAVTNGILTKDMSAWAHQVRLNSNNPRHADIEKPNLSAEDAKLSLEFARALAEVLFVLPSKMPKPESGD